MITATQTVTLFYHQSLRPATSTMHVELILEVVSVVIHISANIIYKLSMAQTGSVGGGPCSACQGLRLGTTESTTQFELTLRLYLINQLQLNATSSADSAALMLFNLRSPQLSK